MERLKFKNQLMYMEGIIVGIQAGAVAIDLKGRLGHLKIPRRMLVSDYELKLGQEVGFMMGHPEVLSDKQAQQYLDCAMEMQKEDEKGV